MELNAIQQQSTWGDASAQINENFTKVGVAIEGIKDATTRNKGYYATAADLQSAFPTAPIGSKAYVGTSYPYAIYTWSGSVWVDSGQTGGEESLNLGDYYNKIEVADKSENTGILSDVSVTTKELVGEVTFTDEYWSNGKYILTVNNIN